MKKISSDEMIESLNKYKSICVLIGSKRDVAVINKIIKNLNEYDNNEIKEKKENDNDKLENILRDINKGNDIKKYELSFVKPSINVEEEWDKLSSSKKEKLTKLELNVIYNILYKPEEVKYINKTKKEIVKDINYFVKAEKRDKALKSSNLV